MSSVRFHDSSERHDVACPRCGRSPHVGMQWTCAPDGCGYFFDTFETHGRCPRCEAQFTVTWCPYCGDGSPHADWYRGNR